MPGPPCSVGVALDEAHPHLSAALAACIAAKTITATSIERLLATPRPDGEPTQGFLPDDCPRPSAYMIRFHRRGACSCD